MPPAPSGETISYGPNRAPLLSGNEVQKNITAVRQQKSLCESFPNNQYCLGHSQQEELRMKDSEQPYAVTFDPDSGLHTESLYPIVEPGGPRVRSMANGDWQIPNKKKKKKKTTPKKKK